MRQMRTSLIKPSLLHLVAGLFTGLLLGVTYSPPARANTQITLSPTNHRLEITPGSTHKGALTVINSGSKPLNTRVYAAPYQVQNENYDPIFSKDTPRTQISRWITFEQDSYQVPSGGQATVPYIITVPASIPSGGQYASIFVETADETDGAIMRKQRVGMLVYAQVAGTTKESGSATFTEMPKLLIKNNLSVATHLKNDGNVDLEGVVNVRATSLFGKEQFSQQQQSPVLPDTTRKVSTTWDSPPGIGILKVTQTAKFAGASETSEQWVMVTSPVWLLITSSGLLLIAGGVTYAAKNKKRSTHRRSH